MSSEILGHVVGARPVMCAVADDEASRHAVRVAAWLAGALGTRLLLAHAFDPMGVAGPPRREMHARELTDDDLVQVGRRAAQLLLDGAAGSVSGLDVATELVEGPVVAGLLELASERWAVALVAGTAARGGVERMLVGSISGALAAAAPCPLVAVPRGAALDE
ncbi:MAG TPA: universal stress protein, partial [Solirubrobacteraceae bacterium]|nr:universal stress protein [Solirubrobacteraceae bacterium]